MTRPADYAVTLTTIICALIAGCAAGEIRHSTYNGIPLVEHIDTTDQPEKCYRQHEAGCSQWRDVDGKLERHIWYSVVGPIYVLPHELAHDKMHHAAWVYNPWYKANCATIIAGAPGYPLGHLLCNDNRSEWTIAP